MTDSQEPNPISPELEHDLRALTTWTGEKPELWQAALNAHAAHSKPAPRRWLRIGITLAAAAVIVLSAGLLINGFNERTESSKSVGRIAFDSGFSPVASTRVPEAISADRSDGALPGATYDIADLRGTTLYSVASAPPATPATERKSDSRPRESDDSLRQVIRKATIELLVPNTRETFAKCQHLLRPDLSEFVEGSSLTGQDKDARAQLTLRVSATGARLDEVLNQLRTLGKVESENATGDDVTAQSVDLDASLRNERTVETEILRLLESRKDAKLQDILELREKLAAVRLGIERLQGRRDTLSRQVALASILVIIRADDAPKKDPPKPASIFDRFTDETSTAFDRGLLALTQTIAFLIRIAIGGLLWWLLLFAAIAIARRAIRRLIPDPARVPL